MKKARAGPDTGDGSADGSSFAQVLDRVSNMADQSADEDEKDGPPASLVNLGEDVFGPLIAKYEVSLRDQCHKLMAALSELAKDPGNDDLRQKVKAVTHTLKGGGRSFGYNLITIIATDADDYLIEQRVLNTDDMQYLESRGEALTLIAEKNMSGNGGKAGRILLEGLKASS